MKKLFFLISTLFCLIFAVHVVRAQTFPATGSGQTASSTSATTHITFPIPELGNCQSASDCKIYCDDPTHVDACVAYAKAKGFYKESVLDTQKQSILADAKATLGCADEASCRAFCADEANADVCSAFAQKHNLKGGNTSLDTTTLQKAEAAFGCTNIESCRAFCENAQNRDKCSAFAKSNGLKGGDEKVGPGGCTSEDSCKVFCSDPNNFSLCSRFTTSHQGNASGQKAFTGPGGCTTEDSCRIYCEQNPTACHMLPLSGTPRPSGPFPTEFHPSSTAGLPTMSSADYCRMYPDHCVNLTPQPKADGPLAQTPTPTQTVNSGSSMSNYESYCESKGPGCTIHETTCVCPTPSQSGGSNTAVTPTSHPTATPTPTGTVQGVATQRNIFQWVIDTFFHLR